MLFPWWNEGPDCRNPRGFRIPKHKSETFSNCIMSNNPINHCQQPNHACAIIHDDKSIDHWLKRTTLLVLAIARARTGALSEQIYLLHHSSNLRWLYANSGINSEISKFWSPTVLKICWFLTLILNNALIGAKRHGTGRIRCEAKNLNTVVWKKWYFSQKPTKLVLLAGALNGIMQFQSVNMNHHNSKYIIWIS